MRNVDLRPTRELTRDELIKKVYKLQDQLEKSQRINKRVVVSEDINIMQYTIVNLRKQVDDLVNGVVNRDVVRAKLIKDENKIIDFVCNNFDVNEPELCNHKRHRKFIKARCAYYYIGRNLGYTFEAMGKRIDKHHVTVLHGSKLTRKYLSEQDFELLDNFIKNF